MMAGGEGSESALYRDDQPRAGRDAPLVVPVLRGPLRAELAPSPPGAGGAQRVRQVPRVKQGLRLVRRDHYYRRIRCFLRTAFRLLASAGMSVQLVAPGVLLLMRVIVVFTGMLSIVDSSGLQLPSEVFQLLPQLV